MGRVLFVIDVDRRAMARLALPIIREASIECNPTLGLAHAWEAQLKYKSIQIEQYTFAWFRNGNVARPLLVAHVMPRGVLAE
jgi:hypothetical protein